MLHFGLEIGFGALNHCHFVVQLVEDVVTDVVHLVRDRKKDEDNSGFAALNHCHFVVQLVKNVVTHVVHLASSAGKR